MVKIVENNVLWDQTLLLSDVFRKGDACNTTCNTTCNSKFCENTDSHTVGLASTKRIISCSD